MIKGGAQKSKKECLGNPKKPNSTATKPGPESIYFKFGLTQDAARFVETKGNLSKYAAVSYKHNSMEAGNPWRIWRTHNKQIQRNLKTQHTRYPTRSGSASFIVMIKV